jgi:hypothetical protein
MSRKKVTKYLTSAVVVLFLTILAWWALEGALRQWSYSESFGQRLETIIQFFFGILSLCTASTLFWWQRWSRLIRLTWAISIVATAVLSSLVWGPPMPLISLAFAGFSLLIAFGVIWAIRKIEKLN